MPKILILFLFTTFGAFNYTYAQDENKKPWDATQPLQWSDFQGEVDGTSPFTAWTYTGISYTWKVQIDPQTAPKFSFTVFGYMDKSKSWLREGRPTEGLLAHEQLHFDINEYFARMLLEALKTSTYSTTNYRDEIKQVYDQIMKVRRETQENYDRQTEHSKNKAYQAAWEEHMAKLLSSPIQLDNAPAKNASVP